MKPACATNHEQKHGTMNAVSNLRDDVTGGFGDVPTRAE
jgi:hypothetical protein